MPIARKLQSSKSAAIAAFFCLAMSLGGQIPSASAPYLNPALPTQQRVDDLVSRMTLEEKISQMQNDAPAIPRLHIAAYNWWNEGLHGVARSGYATVFPQAIGLAATWDTEPDPPSRRHDLHRSARQI